MLIIRVCQLIMLLFIYYGYVYCIDLIIKTRLNGQFYKLYYFTTSLLHGTLVTSSTVAEDCFITAETPPPLQFILITTATFYHSINFIVTLWISTLATRDLIQIHPSLYHLQEEFY